MKKKKGFDPLDFTIEHGALQVGTLGVVGVTGHMASRLPASAQNTGDNIMGSTSTIALIPRMHAVGGVFGSLRSLENKKFSKKKWL